MWHLVSMTVGGVLGMGLILLMVAWSDLSRTEHVGWTIGSIVYVGILGVYLARLGVLRDKSKGQPQQYPKGRPHRDGCEWAE